MALKDINNMTREELLKELSNQNAHIKSLIDNIDDVVYFKDMESRFLLVSMSLASKHSLKSADEMLGKTDFDFFTEEHARQAFNDEQEIIRSREPLLNIVEKETWEDGTVSWVSTSKMPLYDADGAIVGTCGMSRVVTDRIKAELELEAASQQLLASEEQIRIHEATIREKEVRLQQAKKLESLGLLAGGIAHDFSNLITMMRCNVELAEMVLEAESPVVGAMSDLHKVLDRATELTENLFMYAGRGKSKLKPAGIADVVEKTVNMMKASAPANVSIRSDISAAAPSIRCDKSQIEQVAMNLILNAIDASNGDDSDVHVKLYPVDCDASYLVDVQSMDLLGPGKYVCLEISDNGCGMDRDTVARIFDPFFTTKEKGKGLGLAAMQGIVNGHKGGIRVRSVPGKGTTFQILFPAAEE